MDETQVPLIQGRIHSIRGQAVARNKDRFPEDFSFTLNNQEVTNLRSQIVTSSSGYGGRRYSPRVFTEHGALMASTVLRSEQATAMSLFIMRAFVKMREALATNQKILQRLAEIEKTRSPMTAPYATCTKSSGLCSVHRTRIPNLRLASSQTQKPDPR